MCSVKFFLKKQDIFDELHFSSRNVTSYLRLPVAVRSSSSSFDDCAACEGAVASSPMLTKTAPHVKSVDAKSAWSSGAASFDLSSTCTTKFLATKSEFSVSFWIRDGFTKF